MKRIASTTLILIIIYVTFQIVVTQFNPGHKINYSLKLENNLRAVISEEYTKLDHNSYYFKIEINDDMFYYQTYSNFNNSDVIIKDIKYFKEENLKCILPIFRGGKLITDIICNDGNENFFYHDQKGKYANLDTFANNIGNNYDVNNYVNNITSTPVDSGASKVFTTKINPDHYIWIDEQKGITTINDYSVRKATFIELFNNPAKERILKTTVGNYYVTVNYDQNLEFTSIKMVDLILNKVIVVNSSKPVSYNTYFQGSFDKSLYFVDRDNNRQYQLNTRTKKILEVGNKSTGMLILENNSLVRKNDAVLFDTDQIFDVKNDAKSEDFYKIIDKTNNETGFIYYFKKSGENFSVYRKNAQDDNLTFIFKTTDTDNLVFGGNYVYYYYDNELRYYSDKSGVQTILSNDNIQNNEYTQFDVIFK